MAIKPISKSEVIAPVTAIKPNEDGSAGAPDATNAPVVKPAKVKKVRVGRNIKVASGIRNLVTKRIGKYRRMCDSWSKVDPSLQAALAGLDEVKSLLTAVAEVLDGANIAGASKGVRGAKSEKEVAGVGSRVMFTPKSGKKYAGLVDLTLDYGVLTVSADGKRLWLGSDNGYRFFVLTKEVTVKTAAPVADAPAS